MSIRFDCLVKDREQVFNKELGQFLECVIQEEGKVCGNIQYIITSNDHILEVNKSFLNHDYYTDVITFNDNKRSTLNGDIFISMDQVQVNADLYQVPFKNELRRVAIHGILHLLGYNDHTEDEKRAMRILEDKYLCRFN